jgi:hypothetical protein
MAAIAGTHEDTRTSLHRINPLRSPRTPRNSFDAILRDVPTARTVLRPPTSSHSGSALKN